MDVVAASKRRPLAPLVGKLRSVKSASEIEVMKPELDLDDGDLRRPPKQQILEQPHGHRVLQRRQVLRTPRARDGATVRGRPSVRALLRDEQGDAWREREREAAVSGRQRVEHATDEDNPSGCVRFRGQFLRPGNYDDLLI
jgi:hypothetical protein